MEGREVSVYEMRCMTLLLYLVVVQRGVVAQGTDGSQLNKSVVNAAVHLGTSLGTEKERNN